MRILAIRGSDIASLAGTFEVDFEAEPLASAGLYAITGPTGAGKTTLLDCMCLALFGTTPRAEQGNSTAISDPASGPDSEKMSGQDPRHFLRRGAISGMAEVDFLGIDGQRYRATWRVRRARLKREGRLQEVESSLRCLDTNQELGEKKTETRRRVEERLGLSFLQFTRSVLLAQGDFATFLKEKAAARAELLERMTGTEIYSRISVRVFERNKRAKERCDEARFAVEGVKALEPEALAEWKTCVVRESSRLQELELSLRVYEQKLEWHREAEKRANELAEAEQTHACAREARDGVSEMRLKLDRVQRAQALREPRSHLQRARTLLVASRERLAQESKERENKLAAKGPTIHARIQAREQLDQAELERERIKPILARVAELDQERTMLAERQKSLQKAEQQKSDELTAIGSEIARLRQTQAALSCESEKCESWRSAHQRDERLVNDAALWDERLLALSENLRAHEHCAATQQELENALREGEKVSRELDEQRKQLEERIGTRQAELQQLNKDLALQDPIQVRQERDQTFEQLARLKAALEWLAQLERMEQMLARTQAEIQALEAQGLERNAFVENTALKLGQIEIRLDEARQNLERLKATRELSARRNELESGQPCPLCGSTQHPYALNEPLIAPYFAQQEQRLAQLESERTSLRSQIDQAKTEIRIGARTLESKYGDVEKQRIERDKQLAQPPNDVALTEVDALLKALETAENQLARMQAALKQAEAASLAAQQKRQQLDELRVQSDQLQQRWLQARSELEKRRMEQAEALKEFSERERKLAGLHQHFAEVFAEERARQLSVTQLGNAIKALQDDWRSHESLKQELVGKLRETSNLLDQQQALFIDRERQLPGLAAERAEVEERLARSNRERFELLGNEDRLQKECAVEAQLGQARTAFETLRQQEQTLLESLAQLEAALERQREQVALDQGEFERARERLEVLLAKQGWTESDLAPLLEVEPEWMRTSSEQLLQLDQALESARAVVKDRSARLHEHQSGKPEEDAAQLAVLREGASAEQAECRQRLEQARVQVQLDADNRARLADARVRLERLEKESDGWRMLHELIGSADGGKFSRFAQGMTMRLLLEAANAHLAELEPRYRLQPIPGADMELQVVDTYMADEIRPVNSLSGGESFLVSLALALGLSSLSSSGHRIGSLFIDEGFGTLDGKTLEVALGVLDSLQASGRQVGVISHVSGIAERIGVQVQVVKKSAESSKVQVCLV